MIAHVDTLEQKESLGRPLVLSVIAHASVFGLIVLYASMHLKPETWGDPNSHGGGGAVGVQVVNKLSLPSRTGEENLLANNTKTLAPAPPKPETKAVREPEPDAIPIRGRETPKKSTFIRSNQPQKYQPNPQRTSQLYSSTGAALNSPMFGGQQGTGVGVGPGSVFGNRFGAYRDLIEQRISQRWRTDDIDSRIRKLPEAVVVFDIRRDGTISNPRITQSSGNRALDYSAQRAVAEAAPFPPLPAQYERSSASIEIWFHFQR